MQWFVCDGCGARMRPGSLRYTVTIDVKAAYDGMTIGLADLVRDHRAEMTRLIAKMSEQSAAELEAQVYKRFDLDLCPKCQRAYLEDPLHLDAARDAAAPPADIDAFLRSLGYGSSEG